jgi:hypothetical protein
MDHNRPIFVVGCPRSGTTMLQLMLHAHPRIAIPPETRFLLTAYEERASFGDLHEAENRRVLAQRFTGEKTAFKDLGLSAGDVVEEIIAGPPTLGSAMGIVFRAYARRFGKPRWGDKRPAYLNNLDVILRLFPDAQIVNIIRDGRDCVASLKEAQWQRKEICHSISAWARAMDSSRQARLRLPADSYHEVRYERLANDPEPELRRICRYLGEDYDPAMAEPAAMAAVAVPSHKVWHSLTHSAVTPERIGSWHARLEPWEIALCEAKLGRHLHLMGYDRAEATTSAWRGEALAHHLHYARVDAPRWSVQSRRFLAGRLARLRRSESLACQLGVTSPVPADHG